MRKYKKEITINYQYVDSKESETALEDTIRIILTRMFQNKQKVKELLKSGEFKKIYRQLRAEKKSLASFILYD